MEYVPRKSNIADLVFESGIFVSGLKSDGSLATLYKKEMPDTHKKVTELMNKQYQ